jgi:RNA polymerase sigma-70 factor (ECF subfamily)
VDPALDRIVAVFDQDMAKGFSWTGGPPYFPETTGKPEWLDARTCVLPVKLESGKFYRLGINSTSHKNFKSVAGNPVRTQAIAFTTRGADAATVAGLDAPQVVTFSPELEKKDVDPNVARLEVTFDKAMGPGFSWTGGGEHYPETTGKPEWSADKKTCSLPVKLKPGWTYRLGLNSPSHINFQSSFGIPLEPVEWRFATTAK